MEAMELLLAATLVRDSLSDEISREKAASSGLSCAKSNRRADKSVGRSPGTWIKLRMSGISSAITDCESESAVDEVSII